MQSLMIGLGGSIASALPWLLANWFDVSSKPVDGSIPHSVKYAFYIGGAIFLLSVLYTILSSKEYPPADIDFKNKIKQSNKGFGGGVREIFHSIANMPPKMKQLALVQFFTWPGLIPHVVLLQHSGSAQHIRRDERKRGIVHEGCGICGAHAFFLQCSAFLFALMIPLVARKLGRRLTHAICLLCGAAGLIAVGFVTEPTCCMVHDGVGIAWSSILSMPYAMLAGSLPENKIGVYMGIFNFFIVLPEIIASLFFGKIMEHWLDNDRMLAVQIGGALMILAALICYFVVKEKKNEYVSEDVIDEVKITEQRSV